MWSRFIFRRATVARPVGVNPITRCPLPIQVKCSDQVCERGLNRAMSSPVSGSSAEVALALLRLQLPHDRQRFSSMSPPSGSMCSTSIVCPVLSSQVRQYSQQPFAREYTACRIAAQDDSLMQCCEIIGCDFVTSFCKYPRGLGLSYRQAIPALEQII